MAVSTPQSRVRRILGTSGVFIQTESVHLFTAKVHQVWPSPSGSEQQGEGAVT